jgi:pyruvate dehydrogenase E2 component (dihydrolipoamide acetyltransferase)
MSVDVIMPQMGESIFEGTITRWLKKAGDRVERDEPLFEISTDKVDAEIPAPSAGVLQEIKVKEGQTVPIQTVVAVIDAAGSASAAAPAPAAAPPAPEKAPAPKAAAAPAAPAVATPAPPSPAAVSASAPPAAPAIRGDGQKIRSSPLVRKIAKEHNVDLASMEGSGAGGRISKKDILAAVETGGGKPAATAAAPPAPAPPAEAPSAAPAPPPASGGAVVHPALENAVPRERIYFG